MTAVITHEDVRRLSDAGAAVVEALPPEYFDASHIPGAVNLPRPALEGRDPR